MQRRIRAQVTGGRYPGFCAPPLQPENITLNLEIVDGTLRLRWDDCVEINAWFEAQLSLNALLAFTEQREA